MEHTRKLIMRCEHPTPCDVCLTECRRAEITAKEDAIRSDLLALLQDILEWDGILPHSKTRIRQAIAKAT